MTLRILACRQVYSGTNARGDQYTIYEVDAQNQRGEPINEKLRSFTSLPIGQDVEVEVTVFNSERHGKSYTLHPKNKRSSQEQVNQATEKLQRQDEEIAQLKQRVQRLEQVVQQLTAQQRPDGSSGDKPVERSASW